MAFEWFVSLGLWGPSLNLHPPHPSISQWHEIIFYWRQCDVMPKIRSFGLETLIKTPPPLFINCATLGEQLYISHHCFHIWDLPDAMSQVWALAWSLAHGEWPVNISFLCSHSALNGNREGYCCQPMSQTSLHWKASGKSVLFSSLPLP